MARSQSDRKAQEWQLRFARFHKSRQSIVAFCRQEGVSSPSFYLWRKRLSSISLSAPGAVADPSPAFRPVRILPISGVTVQWTGGTQLLVPPADPESLRVVVEALARVDAQISGACRSC